MIQFELLHPQLTVEHLGFLPLFFDEEDPAPAKEQIARNYAHGGGWHPFPGFKMGQDGMLHYPNDPPMHPLARAKLHGELIVLYESSWVAIIQPDGSYEVCRMD